MWNFHQTTMYQIYPFGLLDALKEDGQKKNIKELTKWCAHLEKMHIDTVYFSPIFDADYHGYDTRNFGEIDRRIGCNEDFKEVVKTYHAHGLHVILDGVFNHVGRGFWAFQDVLQYRENSLYKDWFIIDFQGNSPYQDGFYYEGWEGHYELVKLNLKNQEVINHLLTNVAFWMDYFEIDGLRLDVAYMLDRDFLRQLRQFTKSRRPDFFLVGETIHGDYNQIVNNEMLDSCTNYECFKGLYSSFNDKNFFEIAFSLNRQFGPENWSLYQGKHLVNFVDNHDVSRIASLLKDPKDLPLIYGLLFAMPGIPCLYYGSEWGEKAIKGQNSDDALRPSFEAPQWNQLTSQISRLAQIHQTSDALINGGYRQVYVNNQQFIFERKSEKETLYIALNLSDENVTVPYTLEGDYLDLLTGQIILTKPLVLPSKSFYYLKETTSCLPQAKK